MKILLIKDHVYTSSINDVSERIRVITNPSFAVDRLNWIRRRKRKMKMNIGIFTIYMNPCSRIF